MYQILFNLDEDAMMIFLNQTNDFDLTTIAMMLQPAISSKINYYVLSGLYKDNFDDSVSNQDFIVVNDPSPTMHVGTNGTEQTQIWDNSLSCSPEIYINCVLESDTVEVSISDQEQTILWPSIVPNAADTGLSVNIGTSISMDYSNAMYKDEINVGALYDTETKYQTDYDLNDAFTFESIENSFEGMENDVDVTCTIAASACSNSKICSIVPPWCEDDGCVIFDWKFAVTLLSSIWIMLF